MSRGFREKTEMKENPLELIRHTGVFYIPKGAITTELHLAAFLNVPRATFLNALIYPEPDTGVDGIAEARVGNRHVFTTDAVFEVIQQMSKPQQRPRRKGGARCSRKTPGKKRK
jgi:hypothetical protein